MKSFFKKLSLVLAAAMIITLIPAQQTKAADVKTIVYAEQDAKSKDEAISFKQLEVNKSVDLKFYNCSDWKSFYKKAGFGWTSSNEKVATVDNAGVVKAIAAGTTEISYVATGYTGSILIAVVDPSAKVYLYDATDKAKTEVTSKELKAGESVDFNFQGAKGYTTSKFAVTWESSDSKVASVDTKGVVTALAAGSASIFCTITEKASGNVAFAVKPVTVTVADAKKTAAVVLTQTGYETATVTVDGQPLDKADNVKFFVMENGEPQDYYNWALTDSKKGIVTFYGAGLENGKSYKLWIGTEEEHSESNTMVANVGAVASFDFTWKSKAATNAVAYEYGKAFIDQETTLELTAIKDAKGLLVKEENFDVEVLDTYIQNGVVIWENAATTLSSPITFTEGEKHIVTITLKDYEGKIIAAPVKHEITPSAIPALSFDPSKVEIRVGDASSNPTKFAKAKTIDKTTLYLNYGNEDAYNTQKALAVSITDSRGVKYDSVAGGFGESEWVRLGWTGNGNNYFEFRSSSDDVIYVSNNGVLTLNKAGNAAISLYYHVVDENGKDTAKFLKSVNLKVFGDITASRYEQLAPWANNVLATNTASLVSLSDAAGANGYNSATLRFKLYDQNGQVITNYDDVKIETAGTYKDNVTGTFDGIVSWDGNSGHVTITASDIDKDDKNNLLSRVMVTVNVKVTVGGVTKTIPYTVYVYNYNYPANTTSTKVMDEPYLWYHNNPTDNSIGALKNGAGAVTADLTFVTVKKVEGMAILGPVYNKNVFVVGEGKDITPAQLASSTQLTSWATSHSANANDLFVKATDALDATASGATVTIKVRNAYNTYGTSTATSATQTAKMNAAKAIAALKDIVVKVDVSRLVGTTSKSTKACSTYINATRGNSSFSYSNLDASRLNASIAYHDNITLAVEVADTTASEATAREWLNWFQANTDLYINKKDSNDNNNNSLIYTDGYRDTKVNMWYPEYDASGNVTGYTETTYSTANLDSTTLNNIVGFGVDTGNSKKYVRSIHFYFVDASGDLVYVKIDVNKTFSLYHNN